MAENIGSLEFDVTVNNTNANKILEEVADKLKETADAAKDASDALDDATKEIVDAVKDIAEETDDLTDTANDAADAQEQLADTLAETASAADDAAKATDDLNKSLDPEPATAQAEALSDIATSAETATEATAELGEATADNSDITREWTENVFELVKQLAELIRKGEGESETAEDIRANLEELLQANQDLAANPPFTEEQKDILREYRDELEQLNGAMEESDTTNAADAAEGLTDALADAAEETSGLTEETKKSGKAAKQNGTIWNYIAKLFKVNVPAGANAAKFAIESLKMALTAGLLTIITMLSEAIMKLVDKLTFAFRIQGKLNAEVASSTADAIASLKALQAQWNKLDTLKEKEKFINDNKKAFDQLGVSINSVNEAERLLVTHTEHFVKAIMARARASAAQSMIIEATQDNIEELAEAEADYADARAQHDQWLSRYNSIIQQAKESGETVRIGKNYWQTTAGKFTDALRQAQREIGIWDVKMSEANDKRQEVLKEIDEASKDFQRIIVQSNAEADEALQAGAFDESADLTNYKNYLSSKKAAYKDYAQALASTNAEVRNNAAETAGVQIQEGKTYLAFLQKELAELKKKIADPTDAMLDFNKNRYNIIMKEIAAESQKSKKTTVPNAQDELTYYEKLKLALKEVNAQREQGYKPDPAIVKNLKEQIELYEKANGIYDYSGQIARYREFAEKLVEIEQKKKDRIVEIRADQDLNETERESAVADVVRFSDHDIELLKSEYNIVGDDLAQSVLDGMTSKLEESEEDIVARIIQLRQQLATLSAQGNLTDNSTQIATLSAQLKAATDAYTKMKDAANDSGKAAKKANDQLKDKAAYDRLKKGVTECANSFKTLGQEIGGAAGESLEFLGDLTANVMGTITAIQTYAKMTAETIKGVGIATATAIRTVETASVILAVISAAMQIAMQLVQLFQKDKETYEDKKNVYEAYISVLDTIIDREKELAKTLEAQQAAAQYDAIGENLRKQEESTRRIAQEYLLQGTKGKNNNRGHTVGYKMAENLNSADWLEFQQALGGEAYRQVYGTRVMGIFDLSAEQLKRLQENASGFYSKLDSETRKYIEDIIRYSDNAANLEKEKWETINGISFDAFKDNFIDAITDMDASAESITNNIREYMRKSLIENMFKKDYASKIEDYYAQWGRAMENDGTIDDAEWSDLNALAESIAQGATAAAEAINAKFKTTTDEIEEGGLSGAIKNASQESIDLLAGQTNAVRMNQVEGMALARESLDAVMQIHVQVTLCADYLRSINTAVNANSSDRSQGIV